MVRLLFIFFCVALVSCKSKQPASQAADSSSIVIETPQQELIQTWHLDEVTGQTKTYLSDLEKVRPRRGYEKLTFEINGAVIRTLPGPTDAPETTIGSWSVEPTTQLLTLNFDDSKSIWRIEVLTKDQLKLTQQAH